MKFNNIQSDQNTVPHYIHTLPALVAYMKGQVAHVFIPVDTRIHDIVNKMPTGSGIQRLFYTYLPDGKQGWMIASLEEKEALS